MKRPNWFPALLMAAALGMGPEADLSPVRAQTNSSPGFTFPFKKGNRLVARFSGKEGRPISATVYEVKEFRVETFNADGTPNLIGEAPSCVLNLTSQNVSSTGPLFVSQVGGGFSLTGEGFNWNHESERLQLSNRVQAVFRLKSPGTLLSQPK